MAIHQKEIDAYCDAIEALGPAAQPLSELCQIVGRGLKSSYRVHAERSIERLVAKVEYALKNRAEKREDGQESP